MKLQEIDKSLYRQRLNRVILAFIAGLTLLSLGFGTVLIWLFTESNLAQVASPVHVEGNTEPTSNFKYNFIGVVLALLCCAAILNSIKSKAYFAEIYYVWQLKQLHNLIYRRLKKIEKGALDAELDAFIILRFYYQSLEQVYLLDDNTLTLSSLRTKQSNLNQQLEDKNLSINAEQFNKAMLLSY